MPKKILVVDDEPNIVRVIAERLHAHGYEVITASDGLYAVIKAHNDKPDLIILDVRMPAGGGTSVFENLRMTSDTKMIPVIFITAYPDDELRRQVMEMGAEDFVAKPFDADDLLVKVRKALKQDSSSSSNTNSA
jgi:two-component system KDP operon response regulator KdpE